MTANTSGRTNLPNAIQNIPLSGQTLDASHIICGFPNASDIQIKGNVTFEQPIIAILDKIENSSNHSTNVTCLVDDVEINGTNINITGNVTFDPALPIPDQTKIIANDLSSSVTCNDGGTVDIIGNVGDFQMLENAIQGGANTNIQWFDQQMIINSPALQINSTVSFSPPLPLNNEIIAGDLTASVKCIDNNVIIPRGEITNLTMQEGALIQSNTAGTTQQFTDSQLLINTPEIQAYSGGSSLQFNDFNLRVVTTEVEMNTASVSQFALNHELNLTTTRVAITTNQTIEMTSGDSINLIAPTGGIITDGPINIQNHRIRNLADATANKDALNRETADNRYYLNTTKLNAITAPNGSLSLANNKIINLADPTLVQDSVTLNYLQNNNYTKDQTTGLRLDQFALPTSAINLNSQKITGLSAGVNPTDAVNFSQISAGAVQTKIESTDLTNSVNCNASGQTLLTNGTTTINSANDILLNSTQVKFNGNKSTNYVFIYGQSSESGGSTSIGNVGFQIPGIGPVTYPCARLNGTFANWFNFQSYNLLTQSYIVQDTALTYAFKTMGAIGQLMRIEILFTTYSFSTSIVQGLHIGLYDVDQAVFVPESLFCYTNDATNQYRTLRSSFYMKVVSNTRRYVPFFSQTSVSQVQVQSTMGRCTISFKIYPYINLNSTP